MGTFGVGIFSDDTAADLRADFRDLIGEGFSPEEATSRLYETYGRSFMDPGDEHVFWLALAATQWQLGRLLDDVKQRAIAIIESGENMQWWEEEAGAALAKKRAAALGRLRARLLTQPPPPRRVRKRILDDTDWEVGELISYRLLSGNYCILRVRRITQDRSGRHPVCELLDWTGQDIPSAGALNSLPVRVEAAKRATRSFWITGLKRRKDIRDRFARLGIMSEPTTEASFSAVFLAESLDDDLARIFSLS